MQTFDFTSTTDLKINIIIGDTAMNITVRAKDLMHFIESMTASMMEPVCFRAFHVEYPTNRENWVGSWLHMPSAELEQLKDVTIPSCFR